MDNYIYAYYQGIKDGSIVTGKWIRMLYERILDGIEDHTYIYDQRRVDNCVRFIEKYCHHNKGKLAPGYLKLDLWQKAGLSLMFGILDPADNYRQFREVVWLVGRKQGKTLLASGIISYIAYAAGEYGSEIYCVAPKLDQADLVYSAFKFNVDHEQTLTKLTKSRKNDLFIASTNTSIKKIPFADRRSDGYNPMLFIADEIAAWPGDKGLKQWEVMTSGMGARMEPIGVGISSAGYENDGIFDELVKRGTAFLQGNSREKRLLPILYMIDDVEKWDDINELQKSLPGLGSSVPVKYMLDQIDTAHESLSKKTEFLTKYCNIKQNSSQAWLSMQAVRKAFPGNNFTLGDFHHCYGLGGIDLSQTTDLTACCILIERDEICYLFTQFYLPAAKLDEATQRDGIPYQKYIERGYLRLSGENYVDYHDCLQWFMDLVTEYKIYPLQIGYDRYSAQYLIQDMEAAGFHCESVTQGENLTGIINNTEGMINDGTIQSANDNDLLKIHFLDSALKLNAETRRKKLIKISKNAHVDGMAALLNAMCMRQNYWAQYGEQLKNTRR